MKCSKVLIVSMAVLLAGSFAFAQADPPFVFTSDPSAGSIAVIDVATGWADEIYLNSYENYEDLVFGPDGHLYACDPHNQVIVRMILAYDDGIYVDEVEYVYTLNGDDGKAYGSGEDLSPQCGWFTSKGDFIFTDVEGGGAWMCRDLAFGDVSGGTYSDPLCKVVEIPVEESVAGELVSIPAAGFDFYGEGVTQLAGGDAIAVEIIPYEGEIYGEGAILQFAMDKPTGTFVDQPPTALTLIGEDDLPMVLDEPLGIARLSTGDIFVTSRFDNVSGVQRFTPMKDPDTGEKYWLNTCNVTLTVEGYGQPFFLEAAADDTVYVGAHWDSGPTELWAITVDDEVGDDGELEYECDPQRVFPTAGTPWQPDVIFGVAVTPTGTAPLNIMSGPPSDDGFEDYEFFFNDHVLELTTPEECTVELVEARETPKSCLDQIISGYTDFDGDGSPDVGDDAPDGTPVLYLGDKAFGETYYIEGGCGPPVERTFRYAVSAFTEDLFNPRIIRCDVTVPAKALSDADICFPNENDVCEVIDLASFFPGEGVLPDDGRISGTRNTTADFSQYFVVDSGPYGYSGEGEPGCACGFRPPVNNVADPSDDGKSMFREGRSIPFKVRITDGECDDYGMCGGSYIAPSGVLLSIARVEPTFEEIDFECNGGGCQFEPYFADPKNAKRGYHMNVRTDGWLPGTYIATVTVTNSDPEAPEYVVPVLVTYFEIIP